jgi:hypothetical protein
MANNMEGLGTMLAFLSQGSNPGQADPLPEMQAPPPLPQGGAPNLPQSGGGGMLKGILGNLVSGYVGNKLQTHMDNEAAKEQGATLTPIIAEHIKSLPENSPQRAFLTRTGNLIKSGNADNVKSGVTAFNNYYSSMADNFKTTATQKDLQDAAVQAEVRRKENLGGVPQGFTRTETGELLPATVAGTGQTYQQYQGGYISPAEQERLRLSREQGDRQTTAAERTAVAAENTSANNQRAYVTSTGNQLRDEFNNNTKDYRALGSAYGNVQQAFNIDKPTAATDMAGVFGYMKILDPTSVVREGEYASAQNAANVPERIRNYYNKTVDGPFLSPEQRKEFAAHAQRLYDQATKDTDKLAGQYRTRAAKMGVDPSYVITDYKSTYQKPEPKLSPEDEGAYQEYLKGGK